LAPPIRSLQDPDRQLPASTSPALGGGLYSAATYELTADNVDRVLDDVRPYLICDGGDVAVVSVEDDVVSLRLEGRFLAWVHIKIHGQDFTRTSNLTVLTSCYHDPGACSSWPSSTTTMNIWVWDAKPP
jgi:Fe-S cluster biogenesis protein NfuA